MFNIYLLPMKTLPRLNIRNLYSFIPVLLLKGDPGYLSSAIGAAVGLVLTAWISHSLLAQDIPWLIAPMGASAVLLFAAPSSPLAQPRAVIGGNLLASLCGVTCALWIQDTVLAVGCAVALAIVAMFFLRCLHPPSGAVAATAVLGGPPITRLGYHFVLMPVMLESLLLVASALILNNLFRRRYPTQRLSQNRPAQQPVLSGQTGINAADLHAELTERGHLADIDENELIDILTQAAKRAEFRMSDQTRRPEFSPDTFVTPSSSPLKMRQKR